MVGEKRWYQGAVRGLSSSGWSDEDLEPPSEGLLILLSSCSRSPTERTVSSESSTMKPLSLLTNPIDPRDVREVTIIVDWPGPWQLLVTGLVSPGSPLPVRDRS